MTLIKGNLLSTFSRRQETTDCSNNLKLATQQIPSEAVLFRAGCVQELGKMVEDSLIYVLGGLGTVALMGEETIEEEVGDVMIILFLFPEIFGMMCSLCLCCAVKRIEDLKA